MKIINRRTRYSMWDYISLLKKEGYEFLGSGCFGQVYGKGDHVVKIGLTEKNGAYLNYVKAASTMQENTWVPRFGELTMYESPLENDFFALTMELLQSVNSCDDPNWGKFYTEVDSISDYLHVQKNVRHGHAWYAPTKERVKEVKVNLNKLLATKKQDGLLDVCNEIIELVVNNGHHLDCHSGNVMIRAETGEYVITDPVS